MTPTAREHVLEHSGQVDSAIGEPPPSSWPDLIWPPRMLTADADDLGHSRNCSLAVRSLPAQVYPTIMADPGRQNPAKVREFVPVACPIRRSTPGICGHSRLARHPARKAESLPELALTSLFAGRLARSQWPISGSGDPCVSHVRWDHRSGSSGVQFAHDCGSSTAFTPVCSSTGPSPSVRARQLLGEAHRNRCGENLRRRPARPRASEKYDVRPVQAGLSALGAVTGAMQREYRLRGDRGSWTERSAGETRSREERLRGRGQLRG